MSGNMEMTTQQLYRYFRGEAGRDEAALIDAWLGESAENRRLFMEARMEYETLVMNADREKSAKGAKSRKRVKVLIWAVSNVAAAAVLFVLAAVFAEHKVTERLASQEITVEVPFGQRMRITLPDSTVVDLNSGTELRYPAVFTGKERLVKVDGEAMFHVTHNEEMPFIVNTFAADVKVLGTVFNVYADSQEDEFSTSLVDGKVMVTVADAPEYRYYLVPAQTLSVRNGEVSVENMLDLQVNYWTEGLINIRGMSFDDLMRRFEKAYGVDIVIQRDKMPDIDCTSGEVRVSEGIDHALKVLQHIADFKYHRDNSTGIIYIR